MRTLLRLKSSGYGFQWAASVVAMLLLVPGIPVSYGATGEVSFDVQTDAVAPWASEEAKTHRTYGTLGAEFSIPFPSQFALNGGAAVEPSEYGGEDGFLKHYRLTVSELFVAWANDSWRAHVGKISPAFGVAWDAAPGLYGADFAGDYEIAAKLGLGLRVPLGLGKEETALALSVDLFMEDTTVLSSCAFDHSCDRVRRADGGPSNTPTPESFSVTLGGDLLLGWPTFQVGILRRAAGEGDFASEFGYAVALTHTSEVSGLGGVEWMVEGVRLNNFEASATDITYFTAGLALRKGPWNVALSSSMRSAEPSLGSGTHDRLYQLSVVYAFDSGFELEVAWRSGRENDETRHVIGARLGYVVEFGRFH